MLRVVLVVDRTWGNICSTFSSSLGSTLLLIERGYNYPVYLRVIKEVSEQFNSWFFLQVNFTKHLEVADIGHRVRPNVLRMELEVGKYMTDKFWSGRAKPSVQMLHKHNHFFILRFRRVFGTRDSSIWLPSLPKRQLGHIQWVVLLWSGREPNCKKRIVWPFFDDKL